jgi:hypothetical protein
MDRPGHQNLFAPPDPGGHEGGFGRRGGAVVKRSVGDIHPRQVRHHGLELENGLKRPLAHFGLVRRIGAVELRARQKVVHGGGAEMIVGARAQKAGCAARRRVAGRHGRHAGFQFLLGKARGNVQSLFAPDFRRDILEELIYAGCADGGKHGPLVVFACGKVMHLRCLLRRTEEKAKHRTVPLNHSLRIAGEGPDRRDAACRHPAPPRQRARHVRATCRFSAALPAPRNPGKRPRPSVHRVRRGWKGSPS